MSTTDEANCPEWMTDIESIRAHRQEVIDLLRTKKYEPLDAGLDAKRKSNDRYLYNLMLSIVQEYENNETNHNKP